MVMEHKPFLLLLIVLFLVLSSVFSSASVPTSRSLKSFEGGPSLHDQGEMDMKTGGELINVEEGLTEEEGGMDLDDPDYPGTGANNHHDPKSPGRS
ncbi:hypothetical protein Acr_00g0027950 [Actinidia rufa]|uniref:Transmembrane protein n=1 Tax=Actinidia rufa TaxID=165716 RepID=A0A7J0DG10_9ERIC|nr:hypothetical protein Acr_00g0027950 [Actinidia rufa]